MAALGYKKILLATAVAVASQLIGASPALAQLNNPGFDANGASVPMASVLQWQNFGTSGGTHTDAKSGGYALAIWWVENLLVQTHAASEGDLFQFSGYMHTPTNPPNDRFRNDAGARGVLLIDYLNGGGGIIGTYASHDFTTNEPGDVWLPYEVQGKAPKNTANIRVACALLGSTLGQGGRVDWDEMSLTQLSGISTCGVIVNADFDDGYEGDAVTLGTNFLGWQWLGGAGSGFVTPDERQSTPHSLAITFPENLAAQTFDATTGTSYIVDGYVYNPGDTNRNFKGTAEGVYLLEFYDGTSLVSVTETKRFQAGDSSNEWVKFSVTNHAPWEGMGGGVTGRVLAAILGSSVGFGGALYFDDVCVTPTNIPIVNEQSGILLNPGFEYTAQGTKMEFIDNWEPFGISGRVGFEYARSGGNAMQIQFTETLVGQTWNATPGELYACDGYAFTPSADPLTGTNLQGLIIIEFLNASSNPVGSYASFPFGTNSPQDTWTYLRAEGTAPLNTTYARVLVGLVGQTESMSGSIWFDDLTQSNLVDPRVCGLLQNPGFDDGPEGNAFTLDATGKFPGWDWFGGTVAGFVQPEIRKDNGLGLAITYPENLAGQEFNATSGLSYILEGYMYGSSATNVDFEGSARGVFLIDFRDIDGGTTTTLSAVQSGAFTTNSPQDTWIHFAVTARAPSNVSGTLSARAFAAILGETAGYDGALYFDQLCLTETNIPFTNTECGVLINPGFEDSSHGTPLTGIDFWDNFGIAGSIQNSVKKSGNNALQIFFTETLVGQTWPVIQGARYATDAYVGTISSDPMRGTNVALQALTILQFMDATGTNVVLDFPSDPFTTNSPQDTWVYQRAEGVAPQNAVFARTLIGVVGPDDTYAGSVYFDDVCQELLSLGNTTCGELANPGFEDGPTGNAFDLDPAGDLPAWTYLGGNNAGFITPDYKEAGGQSMAITYPNNVFVQKFAAVSGETYVLQGRMFTPTNTATETNRFTSDGSSYGLIILQFYEDDETNTPTAEAVSIPFAHTNPPATWQLFSVTSTASTASGIVTGQVVAMVFSSDPESDFELGGVIYFDSFCVTALGGLSEYEQWQVDNFGSTSGPNTGPSEDFDMDGVDNMSEFLSGTQPTNSNNFLTFMDDMASTNDEVLLRWDSVAGRWYCIERSTNLILGSFDPIAMDLPATPPLNVYTDTAPAVLNGHYYRLSVTTNQP